MTILFFPDFLGTYRYYSYLCGILLKLYDMKRLLLILTLVCFANIGWAKQVTRDQALRQAQMFLSQKGLRGSLTSAETQMSRRRAQGIVQPECYYVFNAGMDQGFVIVSGDDRVETVLGYSTSGHFDVDNIPPAMADLLNHYAAQIEAIRNGAPVAARRASHNYLPDLMTVKWDQIAPYNGKTPLGYYTNKKEGVNCVTGCVATAMAQVLYHQHLVDATQAEIPGYQNKTSFRSPDGVQEVFVPTIPRGSALEWSNMVDNYTGSESQVQKDAVANLMLYCGASVQMNYKLPELGGSTAGISSVPDAFKKYFGYSRGVRCVSRANYSDSEWDDLIYKELSYKRPVIYQGQTAKNAGHAFIVHGYDGDGKYAINWGWGGSQDGYFSLNNLTPPKQGTGGSAGGYNYDQWAVINLTDESFSETVKATITKTYIGGYKTSGSYLVMPTQTEYSADKDAWGRVEFSLAIGYTNRLANVYTMDFGYAILDSNGQLVGKMRLMNTKSINIGETLTYATGTTAFGGDLSVGTYYIKAYSKENTSNDWLLCDDANKYAVCLTVTDKKMTFKVTDISALTPEPELEVTDAQRNELTGLFDGLKKIVDTKQTAATANSTEISTLQTFLASISETTANIDTKLALLESLVTGNSLLSDAQKTDFYNTIADLKIKRDQLDEKITQLSVKLNQIDTANENLKSQLAGILTTINEQIATISNITTTAALDAANAKATELQGQINGYNTDNVIADINNAKTEVAALDFDSLSESVTKLDVTINKAISDAEAAAQKEKENAEKLVKAQEIFKVEIQAFEETIASQEANYNKCLEVQNNLKAVLVEINDVISKMKARYDGIEKRLQDIIDMQSKTLADYSEIIEALKKKIKILESNIAKLESQRELISDQIDNLDQIVNSYAAMIEEAKSSKKKLEDSQSSATTAEEVEELTSSAAKTKSDLATECSSLFSQMNEESNSVINDMKGAVDTVNIVDEQTQSLEKEVEETVATINQQIIDEAEAAAQKEKEKQEFEAAMANMKETIEVISKSASEKEDAVEANNKSIDALKVAIASALETAKSVSDKIAEIKTLLEDKYISEAQKKDYLLKLEKCEKEFEEYQESLKIVSSKLGDAETSNTSFATKLEEVNKAIADLTVRVDAATKKDDVEALKPEAEVIMNHLEGFDVTSVSKDLDVLAAQLKTLSLSDTSTALAELQKIIRNLIDTAKSDEEKEKQEAEKLAKAQEAFDIAIQTLDDTIESQEADYGKCIDVLNNLKNVLDEIDNVISQMKARYVEIEKKLQELIDMHSNTRADNSEIIENLKKKLEELKSSIAELESKREAISDQLDNLDQLAKSYVAAIEEAKASKQKLQEGLSSVTTADEVEKLTSSVTKAGSDLATVGSEFFDQMIGNSNTVISDMKVAVEIVNIVDEQSLALAKEVEDTITGINPLAVDESEVVARYDMKGNRVDSTYKGVQIIRLKNGKIIKLNVK